MVAILGEYACDVWKYDRDVGLEVPCDVSPVLYALLDVFSCLAAATRFSATAKRQCILIWLVFVRKEAMAVWTVILYSFLHACFIKIGQKK